MRLFTCTDHDGYYPVGVASIVVAVNELQAQQLLASALKERGLDPTKKFSLREVVLGIPHAVVLCDGDY